MRLDFQTGSSARVEQWHTNDGDVIAERPCRDVRDTLDSMLGLGAPAQRRLFENRPDSTRLNGPRQPHQSDEPRSTRPAALQAKEVGRADQLLAQDLRPAERYGVNISLPCQRRPSLGRGGSECGAGTKRRRLDRDQQRDRRLHRQRRTKGGQAGLGTHNVFRIGGDVNIRHCGLSFAIRRLRVMDQSSGVRAIVTSLPTSRMNCPGRREAGI